VGRLIIVSNRLPINIEKKGNKYEFQPSVGGVATGLNSLKNFKEQIWVGWPGITTEKIDKDKSKIEKELISRNYYPVYLTKKDVDNYYQGFCNKTIWPLFHYFTEYAVYKRKMWESYVRVNELFCKAVLEIARPDDVIWVHDYQLFLLPRCLRRELPNSTIGFFLHIPFPSSEVFRLLPWRNEILTGILGADLIGVHTYDYAHHLLRSISRLLGYEHDFGLINMDGRHVQVDTYPMGIDYDNFANTVSTNEVQKEIEKIRKKVGERKIILSIDRLDYTKGIPQRLEGFNTFLKNNPQYKEKVSLILVAVPSRTKVDQYKELKKHLDELISDINGKHGTLGWTPIWYLYRFIPFETLAALYSIADIALITPLRDGMNLMAKEFLATKGNEKGVLILSEMAGAAAELGEGLIVNPNDKEDIARAINEALNMDCEEQKRRNRIMQERLRRYNVSRWAGEFVEKLENTKSSELTKSINVLSPKSKIKLLNDYSKSNERLIILDYDGTLVPFEKLPEKAKPTEDVINILKTLTKEKQNEVLIVSGRDRETLDNWFGELDLGLIAEHGAWTKEKGRTWERITGLKTTWKNVVRPILEHFVDRTPGSFIEEKDFSLVWHYRKSEPRLSSVRSLELKYALLQLTENHNLEVLEGNKVVEVRNAGVNKGLSAENWLSKNKWDYILAIGDDVTDEDMFAVLPKDAYSIKVGLKPSKAKFNLGSVLDINELLKRLK
jgi:trehalose 6-phosphate synthase/phosphatase